MLARWLRACLPDADIIVEAHIPETNQRADILVAIAQEDGRRTTEDKATHLPESSYLQDRLDASFVAPARRIAIEFQCANMQAREWRRRHQLYRQAGIEDLWILGGSRLNCEMAAAPVGDASAAERTAARKPVLLRTQDLERGMLWEGAPLLFLDAIGLALPAETLARFHPQADAQAIRPAGRLVTRPLPALPFPFALLDWPNASHPDTPHIREQKTGNREKNAQHPIPNTQHLLWEWLAQRHRVTPENLASFFGLPVKHEAAFACEARAWQAAIYYRFLHRRVEDRWWLAEVETWTRAYLPLAHPVHLRHLQSALAEYQELLAAAGFLSLPRGYNRVHARVTADLTTLPAPPAPEEILRLARYRRTLLREVQTVYQAAGSRQ